MSLDPSALPLTCPRCQASLRREPTRARCSGCGTEYAEQEGILRLTAGATAAPGFDPHYFRSLPTAEAAHFWFLARRQTILQELRLQVPDLERRPLFDIGCGTGGLVAFLAASGVPISGACDAYLEALRVARSRIDAPLILVDEGRLPPLGPGQSMIGLFDVLEHIDDDRGTLAWTRDVLEPGGVLVLTVPAHPFLFDEMDEKAHHRRRYTRGELRRKLEEAGLEVRVVSHFMALLVPLLLVARGLGRHLHVGGSSARDRWETQLRVVPVVNDVMRALLAVERFAMRFVSLPLGSSLLAVAARPRA